MMHFTTFEIDLIALFSVITFFILCAKISEKYTGTLFVRLGLVTLLFGMFIFVDILLNVVNFITLNK